MTQFEAAKKQIITEEMKAAADYENINAEEIRQLVENGKVVIPKNKNRVVKNIRAIGSGLKVKVNANIGTSDASGCTRSELEKLDEAVRCGADAIMDLSTGGDLKKILSEVLAVCPVMVGTVPVYSMFAETVKCGTDMRNIREDDFLNELETHAALGVDFVTLHSGVNSLAVRQLESSARCLGMVSRGGALIKRWMKETGRENPFYSRFDDVLEISRKYDVTLSLGDGMRPGAVTDAGDRAQVAELVILGELAQKSRQAGCQVMIEGPGHVPYGDIDMHIRLMKRLCGNAPVYVLGPLPTDIAAGYDHITAAIGGAAAAAAGADFLCYVTPAEHLCLPELEDVRQGVMASRIAAHIGDMNRQGRTGHEAAEQSRKISNARKVLDWEEIFKYSLDAGLSRQRKGAVKDDCSMCGGLCAIKNDQA